MDFSEIEAKVVEQIDHLSGKVMVGDRAVSPDAARSIAMRAAHDAVIAYDMERRRATADERLRPEIVYLAATLLRAQGMTRPNALKEAMDIGVLLLAAFDAAEKPDGAGGDDECR